MPVTFGVNTEKLLKALAGFVLLIVVLGTYTMANLKHQVDRMSARQDQLVREQKAGAERGYINRAKSCQVLLALAVELDKECLDPNVTRYYDPNSRPTVGAASSGQTRNLVMLCDVERRLGIKPHPDCPPG